MSIAVPLQPDQDPSRWDGHADAYERVFEPLTSAFAGQVLDRLEPLAGLDVLDVAAGAGGTALEALRRGARVTAVDASAAMVRRIAARAPGVAARRMDGAALALLDAGFDLALSSFGVVMFPDPAAGMAELHRVLRLGGRVAVVTWTEPHRYALAVRLYQAITAVRGAPPPAGEPPAQLRFVEPERLRALLAGTGFAEVSIMPLAAELHASSAAALAASLGFAPGMQSLLDSLGPDRPAVLQEFIDRLAADQGPGPIRLGAVAHAAIAVRR
jgi:ubiquinone/menaquinone biosynthesis C-methylase UbiE